MNNLIENSAPDRLEKSIGSLKTYFECRWAVQLEPLLSEPELISETILELPEPVREIGTWGYRMSRIPTPTERDELFTTFDAIIGGLLDLRRRYDISLHKQLQLERIQDELPSNLVPFRRRLKTTSGFERITDKRWVFRSDCLIESQDIHEIRKMAFELHSHSSRYAFLNFEDINASDRTHVSSLMNLREVTLFVGDISEISKSEQTALLVIGSQPTEDRPLIMAGTNLPYGDLRDLEFVNMELTEILARVYIKLTRPVSSYRNEGLIHYFLDSLSESPS